MSTFVVHLSTMLDSIITSKTRLRLLVKFFINAANTGYLRGLAQEMNESTNAIRKELNNLSEAGYIVRKEEENKVMYHANTKHPLFATLQQLIQKHIGIDYIIAQVVDRMGQVSRVFLIGDYAKGIDSGTIEVVIEGSVLNQAYIEQLIPKIQREIKKKVKVHVTEVFSGEGLLVFENKE